jgi:acetyl esterase
MSGFDLDSQVRHFIQRTESFTEGLGPDSPVADVRQAYERMCHAFALPHPPGLRARDGVLHARNPARTLPVRSYATPDAIPGRVVLYFHGGGFVLGSRLSPEHRYPAALDDAEAAYDDLCDSHQAVILAGDSAGATLAVALCLRLRRLGKPMPWAQVLIYPWLHPDVGRAIGGPKEHAPLLPAAGLARSLRAYTGSEPLITNDPELLPLASTDFAGLPPAAIFAADVDPLAEEGQAYAEALKAAGVAVSFHPGRGLVHGYLRGRAVSSRIAEEFSALVSALRGFAHSGHT